MDRLVEMYATHLGQGVPVEVEAAWLHHRFTQIHPFADGNGRVARAISSLVFIRAGWFPLIVRREDWTRYVDALELADQEDLRPLVELFVEAQRNALIQASEVAYEVRPPLTEAEAVAAIRTRLEQKGRLPPAEWGAAKEIAARLVDYAQVRLHKTTSLLETRLGSDFEFPRARGGHYAQTVFEKMGFVGDLLAYKRHVLLVLSIIGKTLWRSRSMGSVQASTVSSGSSLISACMVLFPISSKAARSKSTTRKMRQVRSRASFHGSSA